MEAISTGGHNRAAVLAASLRPGQCTRSDIESRTGLSKATVSRWVDQLIQEGVLQPGAELHREGRGRKSLYLDLGTRLGCVVGVDLGLTNTRIWCSDLRGGLLARTRFDTPTGSTRLAMVRCLTSEINDLVAETAYAGRLSSAVVAVAAGVRDHHEIISVPDEFGHLAGTQFGEALARHLRVPVLLDSDANMALQGEMVAGCAVGISDAAMMTVSTKFRAAFARDGQIMRSSRSMLGELGLLPIGASSTGATLSDLLSASVVLPAAGRLRGVSVGIDDLAEWAAAAPDVQVVRDFIGGLVLAVSTVALTIDPDVVVFNGRMLPVVRAVLPRVLEALADNLPAVPELRLVDHDGYSGAHGSAITAAERACADLIESARQQASSDVG
ncbi:ROK family protein [Mycolicibacterium boenickei]